ncbi:hypothetical protein KCU95_g14774, partial [Aureobasidium melanogenum]
MAQFIFNFFYSGPDGWAHFVPGGWTPPAIAAATNEIQNNNISSTDNSAIKNTTKQSKKYYCSYGHGHNKSHNSQQCYRRKKRADKAKKMLHQEVLHAAQEEFVAVKAEDIKKAEDDCKKSNEDVLARYSNAELKKVFENALARSSDADLKKIFEEVKEEMEHRGIR